MYLEDTELHSLQRAQAKLGTDSGILEAKIIKSIDEFDKYRMLRELEYIHHKEVEVDAQIKARVAELQKPKSFWEKLFQK